MGKKAPGADAAGKVLPPPGSIPVPNQQKTAPKAPQKYTTRERRKLLKDLLAQGLRNKTIAQILGCSEATVSKDKKKVLRELSNEIRDFDERSAVAAYRAKFQFLYEKGMEEYHQTPKRPSFVPTKKNPVPPKDSHAQERRKWLDFALDALNRALDLDLKVGLIEQVSEKHLHELFMVNTGQGTIDVRSASPQELVTVMMQQMARVKDDPRLRAHLMPLLGGLSGKKGKGSTVVENEPAEPEDEDLDEAA